MSAERPTDKARKNEATRPDPQVADDSTYLKTELFSRLAHELRGPVGVITGVLDELERALGDDAEKHKSLLSMARRNAQKLLRTSERLSRTAELEAGKLKLAKTRSDVGQVAKRAALEAERIEARRNVTLQLDLPTEPCMADIDSTWIGAAVGEIVAQALRNATSQVNVQVERDGTDIRIRVRDDGHAKHLPPLHRFVAPVDRREVGLSMPLVHEVTQAHGGMLSLSMVEPVGMLALLTIESGDASSTRSEDQRRSELA